MRNEQVALKLLGLLGLASGLHLAGCRSLGGAVETYDSGGSGAGAGSNAGGTAGMSAGGIANTGGSQHGGGSGAPLVSDAGGADTHPEEGGNGGEAGTRQETGAGTGGVAGTAGTASTFGAAGINDGDVDNLVPGCVSFTNNQPSVNFTTPHGLAASTTGNSIPYVLYATEPTDNTVTLRWKLDFTPNASWTPWSCFDFVPYPAQIAAINVGNNPQNNSPEVYASTSLGKLYIRRLLTAGWAAWQAISLPQSDSHIIDVAATRTPVTDPFLYVIDNDKLFVRHHLADDTLSGYSPWAEITGAPTGASRLCAAVRATDHRQQVFVLTTAGAVFDATQQTADAGSLFGQFESSGASAPLLSDIDCGYSVGGSITVFGLSHGSLWSRDSATSVWAQDAVAAPVSETLRQFTVGSTAGVAPTVFGVGMSGTLYSHAPGASWVSVP